MYCKYYFYDLAKELMADNTNYCNKLLDADDFDYLSTLILHQSNPKLALTKY